MKLIKNLLLASFSLLITRDVKNEWSGPKCNNHSNVIIQNISHQSLYSELYNMKDCHTSLIPTLLLITRPACWPHTLSVTRWPGLTFFTIAEQEKMAEVPEIELIIKASTIDGRRKGACIFCQVMTV